ncbi:MAG: RNA chaperone Hfq [Lachnospirales bacterium]
MRASKSFNLQDMVLNNARRDNKEITLFLMNGIKYRGFVKGFDNYVIILEVLGKKQMIYKHAISTIIPNDPSVFAYNIDNSDDEENTYE